ncbi:MAG: APC family permease [Christensenellaceae bacterium]|nr:APC family permease [Christensenellaceae bacterium]
MYAFTFLLNTIGNALFGRAAAAYIGDVIPFLRGSVGQIALGVGLLTFFYIINLRGIDMMASAQKLMTWVLIAALFIFAVAGIIKMKEPIFDFTHHEFLTQGWGLNFTDGQITGGFFGAVLLFVYSCNGYYFTITYGRDSKNAKRDIPKAMLATVPTLIILYVGVAMAAAGMMTLEEYGTSTTLVFAAQKLFGNLGATLFVIGGPIMALLSTLNSTYANFSIQIGQSCKDGWLPSSFGTQNDKGSYTKILTFMYIVSLIPILLNLSITLITNMMQLAIAALAFLNIPAWLNMPKMYPKEWAKSKFHMPSGLYKFIIFISFLSYLITFLKSLFSMNMTMRLGALVIIIVCVILGIYRARKGNITLHTSVWTE